MIVPSSRRERDDESGCWVGGVMSVRVRKVGTVMLREWGTGSLLMGLSARCCRDKSCCDGGRWPHDVFARVAIRDGDIVVGWLHEARAPAFIADGAGYSTTRSRLTTWLVVLLEVLF